MYLRRHNHLSLWNYFQLDLFPTVHQMVWAASTQLVSITPKFDLDLVSSPRTSQSSQFSNSMRNPTTDVAQSSQLAHPSYFSNPALMDGSNLQSLHVNTNSLPTPTKGLRGRREPSPSPPLSPASSTPHQRPHTHTYGFILSIYPYHCPTLFLCNIEFSINLKKKNIQITANNIVVFQMLPLIVNDKLQVPGQSLVTNLPV